MIENKLKRTEEEILKELFAVYFHRVQEVFAKSDERKRHQYLKIIKRLGEEKRSESHFDHIGARAVRDALGLTRKHLGAQLQGVSDITLYKYESGILVPNVKNKSGKKYLAWLKTARESLHKPESP